MAESSGSSLQLTGGRVEFDRFEVVGPDGATPLTSTEMRLLRYLVDRAGQTVTEDVLLAEVWSYRAGVMTNTVKSTMHRLRRKIEANPKDPRHLRTVRGVGYRFEPAPGTIVEPRNNLTDGAAPFVGRTDLLASLTDALAAPGAMLLHGPAGVGKTRLATRLAEVALGRTGIAPAAGAVWLLELASARGLAGIIRIAGTQMGVPLTGSATTAAAVLQLGHAVAAMPQPLVVLDNAEHLADHVDRIVEAWAEVAPDARIVVTSRARLTQVESTVEVPPLTTAESVQLFEQRSMGRAWLDNGAEREAVVALTRRLDGLPLAIELAATKTRLFAPSGLLERVEDRFRLLDAVQDSIRWSWDLLDAEVRRALAWASVFAGSFTAEDAENVLTGNVPAALTVLEQHSLLRLSDAPSGPRFSMLESIRDFAAAELAASGELDDARRRHAAWGLQLLEPLAERTTRTGDASALDAIDAHFADLRAIHERFVSAEPAIAARAALVLSVLVARSVPGGALEAPLRASLEQRDLGAELESRLSIELGRALRAQGAPDRAREPLEQAVAVADQAELTELCATAHVELAIAAREAGRFDDAAAHLEVALELGEGHARVSGIALGRQADLARALGKSAEAPSLYVRALDLLRASGDARNAAWTLMNLGGATFELGRHDESRATYAEVPKAAVELWDLRLEAIVRGNLGNLAIETGDVADAIRHYDTSLRLLNRIGDVRTAGIVRMSLGGARQEAGELQEAASDLRVALAAVQRVGSPRIEALALGNLGGVLHELGRLDRAVMRYGEALEVAAGVGDRRVEGIVAARKAAAEAERGDIETARADLARARDAAAEAGQHLDQASLEAYAACVALAAGGSRRAALQAAGDIEREAAGSSSDVRMALAVLRRIAGA